MRHVHLHRLQKGDLDFQTTGILTVYNDNGEQEFQCLTIEPPWKGNMVSESCIPNGTYQLVKRQSTRFKDHFEVQDVDYRTAILIHVGNYRRNTSGCILPGKDFVDLDRDGHVDVTNSGATMAVLNRILPHRSQLIVTSEFPLRTLS